MNIPKDCRYTNEHEWVRPDGAGFVKIGVTDYAQGALGDVVYVELPEPGRPLKQMEAFGSVEAVKTVSDLFSPITGEVAVISASTTSISPFLRAASGITWPVSICCSMRFRMILVLDTV